MTIKINEADLLALLGENGEHWVQGKWGTDTSMCLHGAIRRCQPIAGDAFLIQQVAKLKGWGTEWNDDKGTSWSDIRGRLAHIKVTDEDLAETFGPQWEHIVALVRRAAILTNAEEKALVAAGDAARVAAGDAARDAARVAARDVARVAAWVAARVAARVAAGDVARDAAGDAAWVAAGDAAQALVVRDLIGQHGFTQEHYDLLPMPWRTVIGPIHPDDAPQEARREQ